MSPSAVAGVFSRYFIVGFFLPTFFVLVGMSQTLTDASLPSGYRELSGGTQIAVLGGAGLLLGLLLLGLNWQILRLYEGYPLKERSHRLGFGWLTRLFVARQERAFNHLLAVRDSQEETGDRDRAAWQLDIRFPEDAAEVMPTRFGNAVLAFEIHAMKRWGLDGVVVWPRIDMLLSEREAELEANARGQVCFFVNGSLLLFLSGGVLLGDQIGHQPLSSWGLTLYLLPFLGSIVLARWAAGAVARWGSTVRAAIDLHRFELYQRLGVRRARSFSEEREQIAEQVNQALLYGSQISDEYFAAVNERGEGT